MTPLDMELVRARAEADQGNQLLSDYLDCLIEGYRDFCPDHDPQERRSVWMNTARTQISHDEAIALLVIAIDRATRGEP